MRIDDTYRSTDPTGQSQETNMLETTSDRETTAAPVASAIVLQRGRETLRIEPWGRNSVRARAALGPFDDDGLGALLPLPAPAAPEAAGRGAARTRGGRPQ